MFIFGKKSELKPSLGFWQLFLMAVSGTLGAGLFVLMGQGAQAAGHWLPISFLAAGFSAFLSSLVYAELATSMPAAGGGQVYVRTAFGHHPLLFIVHFLTWLAELAFTAINAVGLGYYLSLLVPLPATLISVIALGILLLINLKGVQDVGKIEMYVGLAMVVALVAVAVLLGVNLSPGVLDASNLSDINYSWAWLQAIPLVYLVFVGNEDLVAIAEEVKNCDRDLPKVLIGSVLSITIFTALLSFLFLNAFEFEQIVGNQQTFALLAQKSKYLGYFLGIAIPILACISSLFYGSLADTRTAYALSEAGELPAFFSKINKNKVPAGSIIINTGIVLLLTLTGSVSLVAYIANTGLFIEAIFITLALIKLRKDRPHLPRPFLVKPFPLIPLIVIALNVIFLFTVNLQSWLVTLAVSIVATGFYLFSQASDERKKLGMIGAGATLVLLLAGGAMLLFLSNI